MQDLAQIVERDGADRLVVFEPIEQAAADAVVLDEFICREAGLFHGFVERCVADHFYHRYHNKLCSVY